jgi:hypothetical protein
MGKATTRLIPKSKFFFFYIFWADPALTSKNVPPPFCVTSGSNAVGGSRRNALVRGRMEDEMTTEEEVDGGGRPVAAREQVVESQIPAIHRGGGMRSEAPKKMHKK